MPRFLGSSSGATGFERKRRLGIEALEDRRMLALLFNLSPTSNGRLSGMLAGNYGPAEQQLAYDVVAGFDEAASIWEEAFSDDVTVNININFSGSLGSGILGSTSVYEGIAAYEGVYDALSSDVTSPIDTQAVASLDSISTFGMFLNRTANNPYGPGSAQVYLDNDGDANNSIVRLTRANAKAIGYLPAHDSAVDAIITFSSLYTWDFDRSNGIASGALDFVAVAAHEIAHAMGFVSGVDFLDANSPNGTTYYNDHELVNVTTLDLFRYSSTSAAVGNHLDFTADSRTKYFSIDGGANSLGEFSTGRNHGDGQQASHWKDGMSLGLMDPSLGAAELGVVTSLDMTALDAIGWNRFAPRVVKVTIGGPNSSDGNRSPTDGRYDVPSGSGEQLRSVPVGAANSISFTFNKHVEIVTPLALQVNGAYTNDYYSAYYATYSYDPVTFTATWAFPYAFPADQLVLELSQTIEDAFGTRLDGDWTNPTELSDTGSQYFPSGDGYVGGDFEFVVTILPGDANRDNQVTVADLYIAWDHEFWGWHSLQGDANGDGSVDVDDFDIINENDGIDLRELAFARFSATIGNGTSSRLFQRDGGILGVRAAEERAEGRPVSIGHWSELSERASFWHALENDWILNG